MHNTDRDQFSLPERVAERARLHRICEVRRAARRTLATIPENQVINLSAHGLTREEAQKLITALSCEQIVISTSPDKTYPPAPPLKGIRKILRKALDNFRRVESTI